MTDKIPNKTPDNSPQQNRWEKALTNVLSTEGGYSNDPQDSGGETNFGISKKSYPQQDIKNMTRQIAAEIYKKDFWNVIKGDDFPDDAIAIEVMEEAVNVGTGIAVKFLQTALIVLGAKIAIDGIMGPQTLQELKKHDPKVVLICLKAEILTYYLLLVRNNRGLNRFIKGWFNRTLTPPIDA